MVRLLCCGEIIVEMVAEVTGQTASEPGVWIGPFSSGAPAILADQASLCGAEVRLVGGVGADGFGEVCLSKLKLDGVDVSNVSVDATRPTGVAFVSYADDGSRSFIFHVSESASGAIRPKDMDQVLEDVDCVHIMGSSAFSRDAVETLEEVACAARERGITLSFDPNLRKEMLVDEDFVLALQRILNLSNVVLASDGELPGLMDGLSDTACVDALLNNSADLVVLKRGSHGSTLFQEGSDPISVAGITVSEVDATGAGDCFGGTFLSLWLQGYSPREALELANIAGGLSVTERGPMSGNRSLEQLMAYAGKG